MQKKKALNTVTHATPQFPFTSDKEGREIKEQKNKQQQSLWILQTHFVENRDNTIGKHMEEKEKVFNA